MSQPSIQPPRWQVILAFALIYVIWGSTYLAIRFAIETIPPFLMAGVRFVTAGVILYGLAAAGGAPRPTWGQWKAAAVLGALLLLGGNGGVTWAEQRVPSGIAALMVATVPFWVTVLDWLRPGGTRPGGRVIIGLLLGMAGIALLIGPDALIGGGNVDAIGAVVLVLASLSWAAGTLFSRQSAGRLPASPWQLTAMEMLAGGAFLLLLGLTTGEAGRVDLAAISGRSVLALLYLIVFGALVGFSAYIWLLRVTTPTRAATYAYVNPVVAVFLGWAMAGETITWQTIVAAGVIIGAVVIITTYKGKQVQSGVNLAARTQSSILSAELRQSESSS
jgi:drug/metabolite transporter (DMT)-like permease